MIPQSGKERKSQQSAASFPWGGSVKATRTLPGNRTGSLGNYLRLWIYNDLNANTFSGKHTLSFALFLDW